MVDGHDPNTPNRSGNFGGKASEVAVAIDMSLAVNARLRYRYLLLAR